MFQEQRASLGKRRQRRRYIQITRGTQKDLSGQPRLQTGQRHDRLLPDRRTFKSHLVCTNQIARIRKGSELRRILDRMGQYGACPDREAVAKTQCKRSVPLCPPAQKEVGAWSHGTQAGSPRRRRASSFSFCLSLPPLLHSAFFLSLNLRLGFSRHYQEKRSRRDLLCFL